MTITALIRRFDEAGPFTEPPLPTETTTRWLAYYILCHALRWSGPVRTADGRVFSVGWPTDNPGDSSRRSWLFEVDIVVRPATVDDAGLPSSSDRLAHGIDPDVEAKTVLLDWMEETESLRPVTEGDQVRLALHGYDQDVPAADLPRLRTLFRRVIVYNIGRRPAYLPSFPDSDGPMLVIEPGKSAGNGDLGRNPPYPIERPEDEMWKDIGGGRRRPTR